MTLTFHSGPYHGRTIHGLVPASPLHMGVLCGRQIGSAVYELFDSHPGQAFFSHNEWLDAERVKTISPDEGEN